MRLIVQRVKEARVTVADDTIGAIGTGLCVFVAVAKGDSERNADYLAAKLSRLRIFEDEQGRMNRNVTEANGEILVVSEFTLYGDCSKGNRPSFGQAASAPEGKRLYDYFANKLADLTLRVSTGQFQAKMAVALINDGPVTLLLDG